MVAARAQSAAGDKAPATIAGRVTLDGAGAPGAQVMLKPYVSNGVILSLLGNSGVEQPPASSAVTDAEGRYRLRAARLRGYLRHFVQFRGPSTLARGSGCVTNRPIRVVAATATWSGRSGRGRSRRVGGRS